VADGQVAVQMPQFRQPFSSWSKRMSAWMSAKIASSFSRGTGGVSDNGSPMNSCTRVPACSMVAFSRPVPARAISR